MPLPHHSSYETSTGTVLHVVTTCIVLVHHCRELAEGQNYFSGISSTAGQESRVCQSPWSGWFSVQCVCRNRLFAFSALFKCPVPCISSTRLTLNFNFTTTRVSTCARRYYSLSAEGSFSFLGTRPARNFPVKIVHH